MTSIVVPYVNPDLDGVACAIAIAALSNGEWTARVIGKIDEETQVVLCGLNLSVPSSIDDWDEVKRIWLVDTHHPPQLPTELPNQLVVKILDHHPGGDPDQYPNACVNNETVGAAATLVVELLERQSAHIPQELAILLQAAILSNTLEFGAAATSERDKRAFEALHQLSPIPVGLINEIRSARMAKAQKSTLEILNDDAKEFETCLGRVVVSQLESPGAFCLLSREDLWPSLHSFVQERGVKVAVLNLVDTNEGKSALVASDPALLNTIADFMGEKIPLDGIIRVPKVVQRKTSIVPCLNSLRPSG